ncbi:hypothetical protein BASA81_007278 [Batrachochytrium salamandrivorans]|nr:hypothetical protein BASA81_007278 [Batrachochytrium salamandrivorans]
MKVLLTGPFGNVGSNLVEYVLQCNSALGRNDHPDRILLTCLDKKSPMTESSFAALEHSELGQTALSDGSLVVIWGDLTSPDDVKQAVAGQHAVIHLAAVIPPLAYLKPDLARKVNVDATRLLMETCNSQPKPPRFIYASSYSVFGPSNPHKNPPLRTSDTPINPQDAYGLQKAECEQFIRSEYLGEWAILRIGAVSVTVAQVKKVSQDKITKLMTNVLPDEQHRHGVHSKDVARAFANAARSDKVNGKTLLIGGDDSWKMSAIEFTSTIMGALGLTSSKLASRRPPVDKDDAYYYEEWMDTTETQQLLDFQKHTKQQWIKELRAEVNPFQRLLIRALSPIIASSMAKASPHYKYNINSKLVDPQAAKTFLELLNEELA